MNKRISKNNKSKFWQKTIVVLSLLLFTQIIAPFLKEGLFLGHDSQLHTIYLRKFEESFKAGQFPVRWIDWFIPGYNQPLFNFYQPGVYYLYLIPRALGLGYIPALNVSVVFLWLLSALLMYLFAKRHFGNLGGILAAYLYLLAPYHILDIFVRSALPEFTALAFVPGIFWGLKAFFDSKKGIYLAVISIFTALTTVSHPPTFIMFSPLILGYLLYLYYVSRITYYGKSHNTYYIILNTILPLLAFVVGFGLISFFIIPAFFEQQYIQPIFLRSGYYDFRHHFLCPLQPFLPVWGYGTSQTGCEDNISVQLGLVHWLGLLISTVFGFIIYRVSRANSNNKKLKGFQSSLAKYLQINNQTTSFSYLTLVFLIIFVACFWLLFEPSKPIWDNLPYIPFIQYSWRFLAVLTFVASFLTAGTVWLVKNEKYQYGLYILLFLGATFAYSSYLKPAAYGTANEVEFGYKILHPSENLKNFDPEPGYMPNWTKILPNKNALNEFEVELSNPSSKVSDVNLSSVLKSYTIEATESGVARFQTHYYPGWKVLVNNQEVEPNYDNMFGFMDVNLAAGKNSVILKLENTPLRLLANYLSLFFILAVLLFPFLGYIKSRFFRR